MGRLPWTGLVTVLVARCGLEKILGCL